MALIRSVSAIAEKWGRVTPGRSAEYKSGVENPLRDWEKNTVAAEGAYEQGVTASISRKGFGKGVKKAGVGKWKKKTVELGVSRWPQGVTMAKPDYEAGFAPFADAIAATVLPPRGPKGDPRNLERVSVMASALHKKRLSLLK
jgi:hypothetical protein